MTIEKIKTLMYGETREQELQRLLKQALKDIETLKKNNKKLEQILNQAIEKNI